eukprot:4787127-Prymnesium_polylepis.2
MQNRFLSRRKVAEASHQYPRSFQVDITAVLLLARQLLRFNARAVLFLLPIILLLLFLVRLSS